MKISTVEVSKGFATNSKVICASYIHGVDAIATNSAHFHNLLQKVGRPARAPADPLFVVVDSFDRLFVVDATVQHHRRHSIGTSEPLATNKTTMPNAKISMQIGLQPAAADDSTQQTLYCYPILQNASTVLPFHSCHLRH